MKKSDLKEYIKNRIRETLYAGPEAAKNVNQDPDFFKIKTPERAKIVKRLQSGGSVELEEMAKPATIYTIDPEYREKATSIRTGGPISPQKLNAVLDYLEDKEMVTGPELATAVGFEGKMPRIYPIFAALRDIGALIPTSEIETTEIPDTPENEDIEDILGDEETTSNTPEPKYDMPSGPDEKSLEKANVSSDTASQKAAKFTIDNYDLIAGIIRSYKDSKTRIKEVLREVDDDLSAGDYKKIIRQSKENSLDRLSDRINELIKKIGELEPDVQEKVLDSLEFKFNSVNATNLSKMIHDKLGKQYQEKPSTDTEDTFVDFDDEEISEDVDDVDYGGTDFKDYDSIY
jgi:hypothetical protein